MPKNNKNFQEKDAPSTRPVLQSFEICSRCQKISLSTTGEHSRLQPSYSKKASLSSLQQVYCSIPKCGICGKPINSSQSLNQQVDEKNNDLECMGSCNISYKESNDSNQYSGCCSAGVRVRTIKEALNELKEFRNDVEHELTNDQNLRKHSKIKYCPYDASSCCPKQLTTPGRDQQHRQNDPQNSSNKEKCCSSPVCNLPINDSKLSKRQSSLNIDEIKRQGTVSPKNYDSDDNQSKPCSSPCATIEKETCRLKKCECHFPPAYNQFGCTGNINGNCNCSDHC